MKLKYNIGKTPDVIPVYTAALLDEIYLFTNSLGICTFILKDDAPNEVYTIYYTGAESKTEEYSSSELKNGIKIQVDYPCRIKIGDGTSDPFSRPLATFLVVNHYIDTIKITDVNNLVGQEIDFGEVNSCIYKGITILDPHVLSIQLNTVMTPAVMPEEPETPGDNPGEGQSVYSKPRIGTAKRDLNLDEIQNSIPLVIFADRGNLQLTEPYSKEVDFQIMVVDGITPGQMFTFTNIGKLKVKATFI